MEVFQKINDLRASREDVDQWCVKNEGWLRANRESLEAELEINREKWNNYGYFLMHHFGAVWREPFVKKGPFRGSYLGHFKDISAKNLMSLGLETNVAAAAQRDSAAVSQVGEGNSGDAAESWIAGMRRKLEASLRECVLRHYSPADRLRRTLGPQGASGASSVLKSMAMLENEGTSLGGNTDDGDKVALANHGFVFFYIEPAGDGFRNSRFGGDDPARVTLPINKLEEGDGWLMLNDFADQEFPTIRADDEGGILSYSRKPHQDLWKQLGRLGRYDHFDSVPAKSPAGKLKKSVYDIMGIYGKVEPRIKSVAVLAEAVRVLLNGRDRDNLDSVIQCMRKLRVAEEDLQAEISKIDPKRLAELTEVRRKSLADVRRYSRKARIYREDLDEHLRSVNRYHGDQRTRDYREPLGANILVGADAIPGLAQRCVVEVARLQRQLPDVAEVLIGMSGDDLVRVLLKDFVRPQAMLQKEVPFTRANVEFKNP